jgi:hypothetical protein
MAGYLDRDPLDRRRRPCRGPELTTLATANDRRISQPMAAFYRIREGLIVEQSGYYDLGALRRVLED